MPLENNLEFPAFAKFAALPALLDELRERLFDERIEADAKAGKLDKLMEEAKQDYLAGRCKPFP